MIKNVVIFLAEKTSNSISIRGFVFIDIVDAPLVWRICR